MTATTSGGTDRGSDDDDDGEYAAGPEAARHAAWEAKRRQAVDESDDPANAAVL